MPLTASGTAGATSAYPDAYAKHEARATAIVAAFTGGGVCDGGDGTTGAGVPLPAGFTLPADTPAPVVTAIAWALAQLGTPYTFGGDCTAAAFRRSAPVSATVPHWCRRRTGPAG